MQVDSPGDPITYDFYIKKGDTSPAIAVTLTDGDGNAIDLTGATVTFQMRPVGGSSLKVDSTATITSASEGKVSYEWSSGDTDTVDDYIAEFDVEFSDGSNETFPDDAYLDVRVHESLSS